MNVATDSHQGSVGGWVQELVFRFLQGLISRYFVELFTVRRQIFQLQFCHSSEYSLRIGHYVKSLSGGSELAFAVFWFICFLLYPFFLLII